MRYIDDAGAEQRKFFYGQTRADAERKRDVFLQGQQDAKDRAAGKMPSGVTLKEYADMWHEQHAALLSTNAKSMYKNDIKKLTPLHAARLDEIRRSDLQLLINALGKTTRSESYWSKLSSTIGQIFAMAEDDEVITKNPTRKLKYPDGTEGTHRCLEPWEIDLITDHWEIHRAGIWILLMLYTGTPRGEAVALQYDKDIDFKAGTISIGRAVAFDGNAPEIKTPKTENRVRVLPLPDILSDALQCHKKGAGGKSYVCTPAHGDGPLSLAGFNRGWEGLMLALERQANGLPTEAVSGRKRQLPNDEEALKEYKHIVIRSHDLRHTYATMLYDANVDVKTAQRYLGHADIETTMRIYTHLSQEREQTSRKSLLEYFKRSASAEGAEEAGTTTGNQTSI